MGRNVTHHDEELIQKASALGAESAKLIAPDQVAEREWVRFKCQFGCPFFGKKLTCPPFSPSVDQVRKMLSEYHKILILRFEQPSIKEIDGDDFIKEFNKRQKTVNDITLKIERELMLMGYYKVFALEPGTCNRCNECVARQGKCKFPTEARPSPESLAIDMFQTAKNAGWHMEVKTVLDQNWTNYALILVE
jgi:predicted metal-binding protein